MDPLATDATYAVMWHEGWGNVKGETFDDFSRACARFDALEGGRYAAILVDGRFRELRYYGTRGHVAKEFSKFWSEKYQALGALHLEAAFHFSLARGPREIDIVGSRFSGGFLHESLCWRILEARIRVRLAGRPEVVQELEERLGAAPSSRFLLRGCIFYEDQLVLHHRSAEVDVLRSPVQEPSLLSPSQPTGWWTFTPARLLEAPGAKDSRWVLLLHKRYWLSPLLCIEQSDGRVCTEGDAAIKLKSLEALEGREFLEAVEDCKHLKARNPVLVSEVRRRGSGRWEEVSRGFVLPQKWSMEAPVLPAAEEEGAAALKAQPSITRLQRQMERALQSAGNLDAWWAEVERLESVAEDTERRSAEEQERRQNKLWRPPPPAEPFSPEHGLAEALAERWTAAQTEEAVSPRRRADVDRRVASRLAFTQGSGALA
ncbi:unnamed protein product [Symbiodinium natans]|uniref:Uncharacterized protein n=1 Tax=Symbiodinium natans TaxID=878477 RepID=A0A812N1D4_9DINO|nr:unnamed protein product [Symbiodinium natans]